MLFWSFIILMLIVLSAVFSASETAAIAASRAKIHSFAKKGDKRAKIVASLRRKMGRLVSSLLIGATLLNISSSTLATHLFTNVFGDAGVAYATFVMSVLIILFAEVMPKIYAICRPETTIMRVALMLKTVMLILSPITIAIDFVARRILVIVGIKQHDHEAGPTLEELRGMIDLHKGDSKESAEERAMLRSILDLNVVDVEKVMTHRNKMLTLDVNVPSIEIIEKMASSPFSRIPVYRDNPENIIGILHTKSLFKAIREADGNLKAICIEELLVKPWFVPNTTALLDQLLAFRKRREHFAIVVDEYGAMLGLITLEDILEEIVGEIIDESDIEISGIRELKDGTILVNGSVTIRELNRHFEWKLPDEKAVTIAGLIMHKTRHIPQEDQVFNIDGFKMQVVRRHRQQLTLIKIIPHDKKAD